MCDGPKESSRPAYDLVGVQRAFSEGRFQVTTRVSTHLDRLGWSRSTIGSCVASLTSADFNQSQRHLTRPRAWLDIYKPVFRGERLYVKFTPLEAGSATSFCPSLVTVRSTETEVVGVSRREYPAECGICGARAVRLSSAPLQREFREGTFAVEGFEYERCDACGEGFIDAAQIDPIQRAGVEAGRAGLGRLSSSDIREMRLAIGITQTVLESQLGVSAGTVGRWERGGELQTRIADNFMRLLFAHPELVTEAMGAMARDSRGPYRPRAR